MQTQPLNYYIFYFIKKNFQRLNQNSPKLPHELLTAKLQNKSKISPKSGNSGKEYSGAKCTPSFILHTPLASGTQKPVLHPKFLLSYTPHTT